MSVSGQIVGRLYGPSRRDAPRRATAASTSPASLVGRPQVLFLDEPTTGVDPASRRDLWDSYTSSSMRTPVVLTTRTPPRSTGPDRFGTAAS